MTVQQLHILIWKGTQIKNLFIIYILSHIPEGEGRIVEGNGAEGENMFLQLYSLYFPKNKLVKFNLVQMGYYCS
jgi:hypothetical protein